MVKTSTTDVQPAATNARASVERTAETTSEAIESVKASVHSAVDSVADKAAAASHWASETVNTAKKAPSDLIASGAEYIRSRPYVAVGAALCVGYLIGKLR